MFYVKVRNLFLIYVTIKLFFVEDKVKKKIGKKITPTLFFKFEVALNLFVLNSNYFIIF